MTLLVLGDTGVTLFVTLLATRLVTCDTYSYVTILYGVTPYIFGYRLLHCGICQVHVMVVCCGACIKASVCCANWRWHGNSQLLAVAWFYCCSCVGTCVYHNMCVLMWSVALHNVLLKLVLVVTSLCSGLALIV